MRAPQSTALSHVFTLFSLFLLLLRRRRVSGFVCEVRAFFLFVPRIFVCQLNIARQQQHMRERFFSFDSGGRHFPHDCACLWHVRVSGMDGRDRGIRCAGTCRIINCEMLESIHRAPMSMSNDVHCVPHARLHAARKIINRLLHNLCSSAHAGRHMTDDCLLAQCAYKEYMHASFFCVCGGYYAMAMALRYRLRRGSRVMKRMCGG